jgi:hypothetical protein
MQFIASLWKIMVKSMSMQSAAKLDVEFRGRRTGALQQQKNYNEWPAT